MDLTFKESKVFTSPKTISMTFNHTFQPLKLIIYNKTNHILSLLYKATKLSKVINYTNIFRNLDNYRRLITQLLVLKQIS
jgi:hypothetical protein